MESLHNFEEKDMLEQIAILDDIKESGAKGAIPALFEIYAEKKCDQATHEMVYHTLFAIMDNDVDAIRAGLRHQSYRIQLLSIRRSRKSKLRAVIPDLQEALRTCTGPEVLGEIIMTLGSFEDPALTDTLCPFLFSTDPTVLVLAMEALMGIKSHEIQEILIDLIQGDDNLNNPEAGCDLATILAVEHLAKINDEKGRNFLLSHQDHPDKEFQKAVAKALQELAQP